MPEVVTDTVAKFTPAGIDRDAVLFAAGKAAGRRWAGWRWLAGALAATNAVTLAFLVRPGPTPPPPTTVIALPDEPILPDAPPPDPFSYLALMHTFDSDRRVAPADAGPINQRPPLRAGDLTRFD